MNDLSTTITATTHTIEATLRRFAPVAHWPDGPTASDRAATTERDRGAISLEQVLWFVAAGVSVAVIAAILWNQIRDQANTPIDTPSAP